MYNYYSSNKSSRRCKFLCRVSVTRYLNKQLWFYKIQKMSTFNGNLVFSGDPCVNSLTRWWSKWRFCWMDYLVTIIEDGGILSRLLANNIRQR